MAFAVQCFLCKLVGWWGVDVGVGVFSWGGILPFSLFLLASTCGLGWVCTVSMSLNKAIANTKMIAYTDFPSKTLWEPIMADTAA